MHYPPATPRPPRRLAFTLIELLVVVAIIAILIAILLPSIARARSQAKDVVCRSNVRQITIGLVAYGTSYNGIFPAAQEISMTSGLTWHVRIWDFVTNRPFDMNNATAPFNYLAKSMFECPQSTLTDRLGRGTYDVNDHRRNGYALNTNTPGLNSKNLANVDADRDLRAAENKLLKRIMRPSSTLMLTDATGFYVQYYDRGSALNQMNMLSDVGQMLDAVGRHGKNRDTWNMAFYDGSVRALTFKETPGTDPQYYSAGSRKTTLQLVTSPDVPPETKVFWAGQSP